MSKRGGRIGTRAWRRQVAHCLEVYGTVCHLCGLPGATTADHLIPRSQGGSNALANLRPAHARCNSSRGDRPLSSLPVEFGLVGVEQGLQFFKPDTTGTPRAFESPFSPTPTQNRPHDDEAMPS